MFPLLATIVNVLVAKFAAGVVDTGGAPGPANISRKFRKKFEITYMLFSGAWRKMIHEKNQKLKISSHCPFKLL
jgi:hypothetical protein